MSLVLTGWMLYTFLAALAVMGLDLLATVYKSFKTNSFSFLTLADYLKNILFYILPLMILANLTSLDPTKVLVLIGYYIGGISVIVKFLKETMNKLSK